MSVVRGTGSGEIDGLMILAATEGESLQDPQDAPFEVGLDRAVIANGHLPRSWRTDTARF